MTVRDRAGRTPAHVADFASNDEALRAVAAAGADLNALENQAYDVVTIAAVADDPESGDPGARAWQSRRSCHQPIRRDDRGQDWFEMGGYDMVRRNGLKSDENTALAISTMHLVRHAFPRCARTKQSVRRMAGR